jgi:ornithine decarboxylase
MKKSFRALVARDLTDYINREHVATLLHTQGTPLLLLDPAKIKVQYKTLQETLPMVDHHFAIKALRHPAAIAAVDACNGYFDVMTNSDIDLVTSANIDPSRCIHTNPIKHSKDIDYALEHGLRTFVVDNFAEVDKFTDYNNDVKLLVRLSFRNPEAKSDLSFKFGVAPQEAENLIAYIRKKDIAVAGFSLHVGSQIHTAQAYVDAIKKATELIEKVEQEQGIRMQILDIGGGFPVNYLEPAPAINDIASAITPLLTPLAKRLRILSEPGRFLVASSMTLITQVVGKSMRDGQPWYYLNDGLYGSYSNVVFEQVLPPILAMRELSSEDPLELTSSVLAGPTCDSVDVISTNCQLPELEIGDHLISPMMGAYTWVSATEYNGIARTPIVVLDPQDYSSADMISSAARQPDSIAPSM